MSDKKEKMKVDMGGFEGTKIVQMEFPTNSHKAVKKEKVVEEKKIVKVTSGKVVQKKKTLGKKFTETFLGDNIESVSSYIIYDVVIPAAKSMISDTVSSGIEMLLFGETRSNKRARRDGSKSYVSYSSYYKDDTVRDKGRRYADRPTKQHARHNFDDIIIESRGEAEEVLSHLVDLTEDYGMASVADLYDLVGITSNFTDNKYGWDNLSGASISRVRDGYLINLPKAILLD